jgi:hypothetical protein
VRVQFDVEGTRREQDIVLHGLRESSILTSAIPLGAVQPE